MRRYLVCAVLVCALACKEEHAAPASPFAERRAGSGPVALFNNGGFEGGDLGSWTAESFLNNGVTYPAVNGTTVPPQTVADLALATGGEGLFNRFNYVSQAGVPWQSDAGGSIEYLAWQAIDVAAPGLINVGDDVQAQVIAAGCSLGGHWGEAYVDAFGAFLPGVSIV